MLKFQEAREHIALHPSGAKQQGPSLHLPALPSLPCGDFPSSSLLLRAALPLTLACLLRSNMVMEPICVMCLGAHPPLKNLC